MSEPKASHAGRLPRGRRFGRYEVLDFLGSGGMGEVYRARDTSLSREVALKILTGEATRDSARFRRFQTEAQASAALSHPNIVSIYDVGEEGGTPYIVSELVEGTTLAAALARGPFPTRRLLDLAVGIAEGLAAAHAQGIVHRDLKPANVLLTAGGVPKIADFGLAKYFRPSSDSEGSHLSTLPDERTAEGTILGTVGYMSPEQAKGEPADFRSDQFSLGSILYEMATGKRAFQRSSLVQTLAAIVQEEPEQLGTLNPKTPAPLRWIVERCLAKEPKARYAATEDLARDLATFREHLSEAMTSGESLLVERSRVVGRARRALAFLIPVGALAVGFFVARPVWRTGPASPPSFHRLTFRRGTVSAARFAPDGQTIVYSAAWEKNPSEVFSTRSGSLEGRSLGFPGAELFALSSAGEMALALTSTGAGSILARAPLGGGAARQLIENVEEADWAPDGKSLAVIRNIEGKNRLEFPVGKALYEAGGLITHLRVSPEGGRAAFIEHPKGNEGPGGSVAVVDSSGRKRALTGFLPAVWGLAWSGSGQEVWFSAHGGSTPYGLNAVTLSGRHRVIARAPVNLTLQDISRQGSVLLTRGIFTVETFGHLARDSEEGERNLTWMDRAVAQDLSPDGETILYRELGEGQREGGAIYVRKGDGSFTGPLGEGAAMALSPDGKWVLAIRGSPVELVLLPTGPGEPRALPKGGIELPRTWFRWFADGRRILFTANEPGHARRCYTQDIDGGTPKPVTPEGKFGCIVPSPDGRFVITRDGELYSLAGGEPRPVPGLARAERLVQWSADGKAIYVRNLEELPAKVYRLDLATGRRELWKQFTPSDPSGVASIFFLWITPDAKSYVYSYESVLSDLYLVEGLK